MAVVSIAVPPPIRRRLPVAPRDYAARDRAIAAFDAGEFDSAVRETFRYLLPQTELPDLRSTEFCFVQGSARVRVRIESETLKVTTVLAGLAGTSSATAALRFVLSRISATGQLYQPWLADGTIRLEYADALSRSHPQKLIEVLHRLPTEADSQDGWMVEQFGVEVPDREPIPPLSDPEFARARSLWSAHWDSVAELMGESRRRRSTPFLNVLGSYAMTGIEYLLPLFGSLRAQLAEHAESFNDRDERPERRDAALAKCVAQMRKVDDATLRACLGHSTYAINPMHEGTASLLSSIFGGGSGSGMQTTSELRATGRSLEAALELIANYLYLLAYYSWPPEIDTALRAGLDLASDKPFREAADLLWNHANKLARTFGSQGEPPPVDQQGHDAEPPFRDGDPHRHPTIVEAREPA